MAQKVQTLFIDDIDGGDAEGTVRFALDGTDYEIDLSAAHSAELHQALEAYIRHARRAGATRRAGRGRTAAQPLDTHRVREWAKDNGIGVKERGRVPADVVAKYKAAAAA